MKTKEDIEVEQGQQERIRLGQIAQGGLESDFWKEIIKPILDSQIKGITDITAVNITSEKKASIELAGRILAAKYIQEISTFIEAFVTDMETTLRSIENRKKSSNIIKEI